MIEALGVWGQRWTRRALAEHEVDLGLLLWALEAGARPDAFDGRRTLVELELADQPEGRRRWWYLNERGRCELCVKQPDTDVALYLVTTLPEMIYIWRGDLPLRDAIASERLVAHGTSAARRALPRWLAVCALRHVQSQL